MRPVTLRPTQSVFRTVIPAGKSRIPAIQASRRSRVPSPARPGARSRPPKARCCRRPAIMRTSRALPRPSGDARPNTSPQWREAHRAAATGCDRSRPRWRPGLVQVAPWSGARTSGGLWLGCCGLAGRDPVHALAVRLLGVQREPELLAHHAGKEASHRVLLPASR